MPQGGYGGPVGVGGPGGYGAPPGAGGGGRQIYVANVSLFPDSTAPCLGRAVVDTLGCLAPLYRRLARSQGLVPSGR